VAKAVGLVVCAFGVDHRGGVQMNGGVDRGKGGSNHSGEGEEGT